MRVRGLATWLLGRLGFAALARTMLVRKGRFALNFHGVSSQRYSGIPHDLQPHHSAAEFRQVLTWLAPRFDFLTVDEFCNGTRPGVLLTFDDGHANNLTNVLPILTEFKAQGLFFVTTQHVMAPRNWLSFTRQFAKNGWGSEAAVPEAFAGDCYDGLSESQLAKLARSPWAVIGAHTVSHPSLPECNIEEMQWELSEARCYLQHVSGQLVDYFAYPYGAYSGLVAEAVRAADYRAAFAVDPLPIGLPAYEIPRVGIYASNPNYLNVKLSGLYRPALYGPALAYGVV